MYSRRDFLKTAGVSAFVLGVDHSVLEGRATTIDTIVAGAKAEPAQIRKITYAEAAKGDDTLKQQYLDQLLRDNPSPYVKGLIYDTKGRHRDSYIKELIAKGLLDPSEIKEKDNLDSMIDKILEGRSSLSSPQEREAIKQCVKQALGEYGITKESIKIEIEEAKIAGIVVGPRMIGRNEKQYVFVKAGFFEGGDEDLAKIWLSHEYTHAEHAYGGIRFGPFGIDYRTAEKQKIQHETLGVLGESLAWIDTIQRLRRNPKYGSKSEAYIEAVGTLFIYDSALRAVKPKSNFEKKIIEYQSQQNQKYLPQAVVAEFKKRVQRIIEQEIKGEEELLGKALKCIDKYLPKKPLNLPPPPFGGGM